MTKNKNFNNMDTREESYSDPVVQEPWDEVRVAVAQEFQVRDSVNLFVVIDLDRLELESTFQNFFFVKTIS